jgi:DDE superfamily endonuclease
MAPSSLHWRGRGAAHSINFAEIARKTLPEHARGKPIEVWFQDEARVGQQGTLTYVWAERGSRPPVTRDNRHHSVWLFGAVCPERGTTAALVLPHVCAEAMTLHLAELSTQVASGSHALVLMDGAGWHQTGVVRLRQKMMSRACGQRELYAAGATPATSPQVRNAASRAVRYSPAETR